MEFGRVWLGFESKTKIMVSGCVRDGCGLVLSRRRRSGLGFESVLSRKWDWFWVGFESKMGLVSSQ